MNDETENSAPAVDADQVKNEAVYQEMAALYKEMTGIDLTKAPEEPADSLTEEEWDEFNDAFENEDPSTFSAMTTYAQSLEYHRKWWGLGIEEARAYGINGERRPPGPPTLLEIRRNQYLHWHFDTFRKFENQVRAWHEERRRLKVQKKRLPIPKKQPLPLYLLFPADKVHKAAVEALSTINTWGEVDGFGVGRKMTPDKMSVIVGFRDEPPARLWGEVCDNKPTRRARLVQMHYALWARLYQETDADPKAPVAMNVNQLCEDLQYKKAKNGGFKTETKGTVMNTVELLFKVEIAMDFTLPGPAGRTRRLRGPLWTPGLMVEDRDNMRIAADGGPVVDPQGFTYQPGPWFSDPDLRKRFSNVGRVNKGLLEMNPAQEEWAILIGGYIAAVSRMNKYQMQRLKVSTILGSAGVGLTDWAREHPEQAEQRFEAAMDDLEEKDVITSWRYKGSEAEPKDWAEDEDDLDAMAAYYDAEEDGTDWRTRVVLIEYPSELKKAGDTAVQNRAKHVAKAQRRKAAAAKAAGPRDTAQGG